LATVLMAGSARPVQFDLRPGVTGAAAARLAAGDVESAVKAALKNPGTVVDPSAFRDAAMGTLAGARVRMSDQHVLFINADGFASLSPASPERAVMAGVLSAAARGAAEHPNFKVVLVGEAQADVDAVKAFAAADVLDMQGRVTSLVGAAVSRRDGRVDVRATLRGLNLTGRSVQPVALEEASLLLDGVNVLSGIYLRVFSREIAEDLRQMVFRATQA
jgi:hypothetical protein